MESHGKQLADAPSPYRGQGAALAAQQNRPVNSVEVRDNLPELLSIQQQYLMELAEALNALNNKLDLVSTRRPETVSSQSGLGADPHRVADRIRFHTAVVNDMNRLVQRMYSDLDF